MSNLNINNNNSMQCHRYLYEEELDPPAPTHTDLMQTMGRFNMTPY